MGRYRLFLQALVATSCASLLAATDAGRASQTAAIKTAVEKSIALLRDNSPNFLKRGGCNSCHNQFLPAVAQALARQRGFAVGKEIAQLPIDMGDSGSADRALEGLTIGSANSIGYVTLMYAALRRPADEFTDAWLHQLKAFQKADGHWQTGGNRPPLTYDDYLTTALSLRAMQAYTPEGQRAEYQKRVERAASWLREASPQTTLERSFHLLGLGWTGASNQLIRRAVDGLLASQGPEGGWPQLPAMEKDAYATGMALYALHIGGRLPVSDAAYQRGIQYLLTTQAADGSWHVKARAMPIQPYFESGLPYGADQWISAAGTSWAAMALALTAEPVRLTSR